MRPKTSPSAKASVHNGHRYRLLFVAVLNTLSLAAAAAEDVAPLAAPTPSTTLSAAARAANSAVNAANAAAAAASAAAAAAATAVDAINAILPPSQRILPVAINAAAAPAPVVPAEVPSANAPAAALASQAAQPLRPTPEPPLATPPTPASGGFSGRFATPSERSLVGLVGAFEVPVVIDARGVYAAGVAGAMLDGAEPVEAISGIDLSQAVRASLGFSRDVLAAAARVDQANAQTGQARAFLLPSLLLNMAGGRENSTPGVQIDPITGKPMLSSNHSRSDRSISLKQTLFDLPSLQEWNRRELLEKSRAEGQRSSAGDAYLATVTAYLALISSRVQADMVLDYEAQLQELFKYVEQRAQAGAASESDKERVRARNLNVRSSRIEQESAQAAAGVEFIRLVNLAPRSLRLPDLEDLGMSRVPPGLEQALPMAMESNPEIAGLQAELKAADIDQTAAKNRYAPRVNLELSDTNALHAGGSPGSQHDQRVMLVFNWSLFNGGGDLKIGQEKAARYSELRYKLDDQRRRLLQSLSAQYATLEATRERITTGYRELESIATAARAMSNRMISGNQSLLDMLDVYDRFYQARTHLVALHVQEMGAVAQISRLVLGTPASDLKVSVNNASTNGLTK